MLGNRLRLRGVEVSHALCMRGSWWRHEGPRTECDDKEHGKCREMEEHGVWVYRMDESKVKYEGSKMQNADITFIEHSLRADVVCARSLNVQEPNTCFT